MQKVSSLSILAGSASLMLFAACSSDVPNEPVRARANGITRSNDIAVNELGPDSSVRKDYVATPAGLYHKTCVHEIPDHASVDRNGTIHLPNGSAIPVAPCA